MKNSSPFATALPKMIQPTEKFCLQYRLAYQLFLFIGTHVALLFVTFHFTYHSLLGADYDI